MLKIPELGWALVDARGALVVIDGRLPVYWRRRVAQLEANEHGFTTTGTAPDVRICRVTIHSARRRKD